jgi:dTDP-4-dehydrorhamnose reductase
VTAPEVWAGLECSYVGVRGDVIDELALTGARGHPEWVAVTGDLKATAVRCPVLWGWPDGRAGTDWDWAARAIDALARRGIRPIVELLHHGAGPSGSSLVDPALPARFADFALAVAERFPEVQWFLPINEPLTTARFSGLYGWWEPHVRDHRLFVRMLLNQCLAFRDSVVAIRTVRPEARFVATEDVGRTRGTAAVRAAVRFDNARRWLTFDLLTGRVRPGHPLWRYLTDDATNRALAERLLAEAQPPDVIGLDYYVTSDRFLDHRLERYPSATHGGDAQLRYADVELVRAHVDGITGFRRILREAWRRYAVPLALTEVHLEGPEADRAAWWNEAWRAANEAAREGIPVLGVTAWAALGAAGWATLLTGPEHAYEPGAFDARNAPPTLTAEGAAIAHAAAGKHPTAIGGWWRAASRILYDSPVDTDTTPGREAAARRAASSITSSNRSIQRGTTTSVA